ncbi:MAG TPA: hypothetical protein VKN63_08950, partial [Afifellaceae bacterium]|nr:hypothetical protein [Afifellaceae bacterium]
GAGSGGNPFEDPASQLRRPRFGVGMEGPPAAGGDAPGNPGHASSSGWVQQPSGSTPGRTVWSKNWDSIGTTTYVVQTNADGSITGTLTLWVDADDNQPGRVDSTTETTFSPPDENGSRTVTTKTTDSNGNTTEQTASENSDTPRAPTPTDQNADGVDDDRESERVIITDPESEQPAPHDNDAGRGTGGCGVWTPFGGCTGTGPKVWDTTGQPNPADDGSATVRSAGASIGPEAVTNGGDGSFGAEGNSGRGGGFGIDPCATVAECGDGSGGPDNPVGSVDAAHAADR